MNQRTLPRYASVASLVVMGIACLVLVGWWTDIPLLKSIAPGLVAMKVNTACALVCCGFSLHLLTGRPTQSLRRTRVAQASALVPLAVGVLTIVEHVADVNLGIDSLLQQWTLGTGPMEAARMSPVTASCLGALGVALLALTAPQSLRLARAAAAYVLTVSLLAGIGYTFRIIELYAPGNFQAMALHTTLSCVLLASGVLVSPQSIGSRGFRDWPVQTKMVCLLLGASLAPFLLFALLEIRAVAQHFLDTQAALLAARADQLSDEIDDFELDRRHMVAQLAAASAAIGCCERATPQLSSLLQGVQSGASEVVATALIGPDGSVLQHAGAQPPETRQLPALRAALSGGTRTTELHVAHFGAQEEPVLLYAAPVRAADGVQGAAAMWVRASALWRILTNRNDLAGRDSFAVLVDALGIRLAHTYNQQLVFRPAGPLRPWDLANAVRTQRFGPNTQALLQDVRPCPGQLERALAKNPDREMFRDISPAKRGNVYAVGRRLKTLPWTLFYSIPESSVHEGLAPHSRNRTWFAVLLGALSVILGAVYASALLRPLRRLSDATARIGSGQPSTPPIEVESHDELGLLAERFNLMMQRIEVQANELRRINEELELRVVQRTAELSQSEQDLAITLNSIGDAVIATDQRGRVERMNPLAEKLTGWSMAEAHGMPLDEVFAIADEETGAACPSPVARVIRDGVVVALTGHTVLVSRSGKTCPISDSAAPIFTREGRLRGVVLVFRDVREERRAQLALQASEALYRELYESHPDLCATVDMNTECIIECNQTMATQLGYTKEELVGKPLRSLYSPDAVVAGEAARGTFRSTHSLRDHERTLVRKDGSLLETSLSLTGRHDSRGALRAKAVWRDISVRKQAERDQQFLFSLSELQSLATDPEDLIAKVNARLAEHLGAARSCFVEVDDAGDVFHLQRDYHHGLASMAGTYSLLAFGEAIRNEQRAGKITVVSDARADPRTAAQFAAWEPFGIRSSVSVPLIRQGRWVVSLITAHIEPHRWSEREIALIRSVAERAWLWIEQARLRRELHVRETRELARKSDERFHALVNNVSDYAIYLLDATGHITSWNRGAERIKGYSEAEVLGKHFSLFFTEEDLARGHANEALHTAAREGRFEEEAWRRRKDGTHFWANVVLTALYDAQGKVEAFAKVTRDHTERRRTEEALRQRQTQLAASLREREVLLQEVHHRVKNNLQVISSLLSMQMRQVHEAHTRGALDESRRRVEAIALIHEKLYQSVDYSKVQFSEYVSTLAANVFHTSGISPSDIKLKLQVEPVSLAVDKAIPCGLVLNELITNTLKHGFPDHRRGTVKVELRKLPQGKVLLLVADDGVGIPADFDLESSESLGMQLVTTLVEQVRGELEIVRAPGTTFRIRVPVEMPP